MRINKVTDLIKKPSIFKKPIDNSDRWNVYTLSKYLSKYEFGIDKNISDKENYDSCNRQSTHLQDKRKSSLSKNSDIYQKEEENKISNRAITNSKNREDNTKDNILRINSNRSNKEQTSSIKLSNLIEKELASTERELAFENLYKNSDSANGLSKDALFKHKFSSPECKTMDIKSLEQNNEFNPAKTSVKVLKHWSVRNSLNDNKFSEKTKK